MERFVKGNIVVINFPFSDFSAGKKRPAYVIADLTGDDIILCQITSQNTRDSYAIELFNSDFDEGSLTQSQSNIRPNQIFTAEKRMILKTIGRLKKQKSDQIINRIIKVIR